LESPSFISKFSKNRKGKDAEKGEKSGPMWGGEKRTSKDSSKSVQKKRKGRKGFVKKRFGGENLGGKKSELGGENSSKRRSLSRKKRWRRKKISGKRIVGRRAKKVNF